MLPLEGDWGHGEEPGSSKHPPLGTNNEQDHTHNNQEMQGQYTKNNVHKQVKT